MIDVFDLHGMVVISYKRGMEMRLLMLLCAVLLSGCYAKNFKLIEHDIKTLQGEVSALRAQTDLKMERLKMILCKTVKEFNIFHNFTQYGLGQLEEFKKAHDKRWPKLKER